MTTDLNSSIKYPAHNSFVFLQGKAGKLELLVSLANDPKLVNNSEIIAIICHPHPLHGGTMNNKVVYTVHTALNYTGLHTIRFNFRGVGHSDGVYDYGNGECDDLMTVINWVKNTKPNYKIVLAGFSFGAFIAFKATKNIDCSLLLTIAPAINHQDYTLYLPINCHWMIIYADNDEIVPAELVSNWASALYPRPDLIKLTNASHFFHGRLIELKTVIIKYLKNTRLNL